MPSYTNVPKPTGSVYSMVAVIGKQTYDDSGTTYDNSATYYDGVESGVYTNVSKPIGSVYTKVAKPT